MKKFVLAALLLGLTVGSTYASPASVCETAQSEIPENHVCILLEESAEFFSLTHEEAAQAYESGELKVLQIERNAYRVEMGGSWIDIAIDAEL